jgi:hypothetical protein
VWCAAVGDEERGRGKDGEEEAKDKLFSLIYMQVGASRRDEKVVRHLCGPLDDTLRFR